MDPGAFKQLRGPVSARETFCIETDNFATPQALRRAHSRVTQL